MIGIGIGIGVRIVSTTYGLARRRPSRANPVPLTPRSAQSWNRVVSVSGARGMAGMAAAASGSG